MKDFFKNIIKKIYIKENKQILDGKRRSQASKFYDDLPEDIRKLSLGCGNPINFIGDKFCGNVLDIGCGMGVDIISLSKKNKYNSITGIELTQNMAVTALDNTKDIRNVNIACADMEAIPFLDNYFDMIISNAAIHLVKNKRKVFSECKRIIKNSGIMVVSDLMIKGKMPKILTDEYKSSEGLFLFGGLRTEEEYISSAQKSGFRSIEIIERKEFRPAETIVKLLMNVRKLDEPSELLNRINQIKFYSNIIILKPYINSEKVNVKCSCGNIKEIIYINPMNITVSPVLADEIINKNINYTYCEKCQKEIFTPDPLLFHDMNKRIMIHIFPLELKSSEDMIKNMVKLKVGTGNLEGYTHKIFFGLEKFIKYVKENYYGK